jgi:hypothetical protein
VATKIDGYSDWTSVGSVKYFNTAGPCLPELHYMLPPEPRLPDALRLIAQGQYFVVHAPRQSGKTTTLLALTRDLRTKGERLALYVSCGSAAAAGDDYAAAERQVLAAIRDAAFDEDLPPELQPPDPWPAAPSGRRLNRSLSRWAASCPLPIVLFLDEIDALTDASLISVLQQIRDGFPKRPRQFPASVVLCGLRDVRDYKAASGADPSRLGTASPFNIKVASLRVEDFTRQQVADLYGQHTAETGQEFTAEATNRAFGYTNGQPWLVNALAREITEEMRIEPPVPIIATHVDEAKERLILARATHLDSLIARLHEPRVQRVIEPLLAGLISAGDGTYDEDMSYVRDLGLVAPGKPIAVANPIYREVIARVLSARAEDAITVKPRSYLLPDGRLDFRKVLEEFTAFWRAHGDVLTSDVSYHEAAPQLVLMAWLQRIVNGGGYVEREYGVGRGRIDLLVRKPYGDGQTQLEAVELKVWRPGAHDPLPDGLAQLDTYLAQLGLDTGTLIIFDRRKEAAPFAERGTFTDAQTPAGRGVTLLRA